MMMLLTTTPAFQTTHPTDTRLNIEPKARVYAWMLRVLAAQRQIPPPKKTPGESVIQTARSEYFIKSTSIATCGIRKYISCTLLLPLGVFVYKPQTARVNHLSMWHQVDLTVFFRLGERTCRYSLANEICSGQNTSDFGYFRVILGGFTAIEETPFRSAFGQVDVGIE